MITNAKTLNIHTTIKKNSKTGTQLLTEHNSSSNIIIYLLKQNNSRNLISRVTETKLIIFGFWRKCGVGSVVVQLSDSRSALHSKSAKRRK